MHPFAERRFVVVRDIEVHCFVDVTPLLSEYTKVTLRSGEVLDVVLAPPFDRILVLSCRRFQRAGANRGTMAACARPPLELQCVSWPIIWRPPKPLRRLVGITRNSPIRQASARFRRTVMPSTTD